MKCAEYIAASLIRKGITHVFELSGGMITYLLDALHRSNGIDIVSIRHEQAAAFAADAYGRITGIPGVAMATSGPGATNLLTGIASCYFDSSPAVFITGQVNRNEQKKDRQIRQLGFQETDIVTMARPITKAAYAIQDIESVPSALDRAFKLAVSGRPGPVLIDIPMDIQRSELDGSYSQPSEVTIQADAVPDFSAVLAALKRSRRPLILAGGGIRSSRSIQSFRQLVDRITVPVVHSLMAVDVLPSQHPLRIGMIGSYGNRWANTALMKSDLLIVIGSRLDVRQTGSRTDEFKKGREIVHIDCDPGEMNNRVTGCTAINAELQTFLQLMLCEAESAGLSTARFDQWLHSIQEMRRKWPDTAELPGIRGINPNVLMHELSGSAGAAAAFIADVGQHQMWAAQSIELVEHQRFLTSGGMGSMGFGLPAAIGASLATAGPVVLIAGDGGFQCNIQELQTVIHRRLPIKMIVLNNGCHGMVRQFQESYFESRYQSTWWGYSAPDFTRVAEGYGICATSIDRPEQMRGAAEWLWKEDGPRLLQVMIDPLANAYPKVAFGKGIDEMEPFAKPSGIEST
jgi:acetolactate synthase I/II/III large subunit